MGFSHFFKFAMGFLAFIFCSGIAAAAGSSFYDPAKSILIASIFGMIAILFLCYILLKYGGEAQ